MTNDPTTTKEPEKLDPEVARYEKETARTLARRKLAEARLGALEALSPGVTDLPKNEVTLGAKAGALGPWLAQDVLAGLAGSIATEVGTALASGPAPSVVFVTADAHLLAGDVTTRQVRQALEARVDELSNLERRLAEAGAALDKAVAQYEQEELAPVLDQTTPPSRGVTAGTGADDKAASPPATGAAATAAGPLGVAIDLVRLLATDYTVTAADVTVDSAHLARLTAGALAGAPTDGPQVLLDGVALASGSPTLASYEELAGGIAGVVDAAQQLAARVAPVVAEADVHQTAADQLREAWRKTLADKEAEPGAAAELERRLDLQMQRLTVRRAAAAPAEKLLEQAEHVVTAVRAEVAALAEPDATGVTPLQRACSRDRLHRSAGRGVGADGEVTHVLLVAANHAGADVITRRSVLGVSGRVAYLGGANGSWVLVAADGRVTGGGASAGACQMTHDIATGEARGNPVVPSAKKWKEEDPLARNENLIRIGVLLLALGIALVGLAATLSVFL